MTKIVLRAASWEIRMGGWSAGEHPKEPVVAGDSGTILRLLAWTERGPYTTGGFERVMATRLLVVGPHSEYPHGSLILKYLIHESVLDIDPS